jgi:L-ascorbate metabolism protein UlaG (beta-lactamase superfamily)
MQLQLIRNATLRLEYGGHIILLDPFFAPKHSRPSFKGKSGNPLVDLPIEVADIINGVKCVVVSHLHGDHFDEAAQDALPKNLPLFCQPGDEDTIQSKGFTQVSPMSDSVMWQGISITRTDGNHGVGEEVLQLMGKVSGFVFRAEGEPSIYWTGDTVWYEAVQEVVKTQQPGIIITHSSGAMWADFPDPIVMDAAQTVAVCKIAPNSKVIAIHMESLDHGTVTRTDLRAAASQASIPEAQLIIPADGETLSF